MVQGQLVLPFVLLVAVAVLLVGTDTGQFTEGGDDPLSDCSQNSDPLSLHDFDLESAFTNATSVNRGQPANITFTVYYNSLQLSSPNVSLNLTDLTDNVLKGSRIVGGIPGNNRRNYSFTYTTNGPAGSHILRGFIDANCVVAETNESNNKRNITITVNNQLPVTDVSHSPINPTAEQNVTFTANASDDANVTEIKIFVDGLLQKTCPFSQSSATCAFTSTSPYSPGSHTYNSTVMDNDGATNSVQKTFSVSGGGGQADLTVSSSEIVFSPSSPQQNQNFTINATVRNSGSASAGNFKVKFDDITTGQHIGNFTVSSLPEGGSSLATIVANLSTTGNHTIQVTADADDSVNESNENNNVASKVVDIQAGPVSDLSVSQIIFSSNPQQNQNTTINATVANSGNQNVGSFKVKFDDTTTGAHLGNVTVSSLNAGSSTVASFVANFTASGNHTIRVTADADNVVSESNENNNELNNTVNVQAVAPDLTLTSPDIIFIPTSPTQNQNATINATIRNSGNANSGSFKVRFYDTTTSAEIANYTIASIGSGSSAVASVSVNFTTAGSHTVQVTADVDSQVSELNESNNVASKSVGVLAPNTKPDLIVSNIAFSPASPIVNENSTITATVNNTGNGSAGVFNVSFKDNTTSETKVKFTTSAIDAGSSVDVSITWNFNVSGDHTFVVTADSSNTLQEWNESNNNASATVIIQEQQQSSPPSSPSSGGGSTTGTGGSVENTGSTGQTSENRTQNQTENTGGDAGTGVQTVTPPTLNDERTVLGSLVDALQTFLLLIFGEN